jgi:hypothetical protein
VLNEITTLPTGRFLSSKRGVNAFVTMSEKLSKPLLRILSDAYPRGTYRSARKPVGTNTIENVLAQDINGLEPRLTRQGYNGRAAQLYQWGWDHMGKLEVDWRFGRLLKKPSITERAIMDSAEFLRDFRSEISTRRTRLSFQKEGALVARSTARAKIMNNVLLAVNRARHKPETQS